MSVRLGSLFYKPRNIEALLAHSVRLVVHEVTFEERSTFGLGGSCTLLTTCGHAFVVTTRHQLGLRPGSLPQEAHLSTLRFSASDGSHLKNIPVDRVFYEENNPGEEYHDLLFFAVEPSWLQTSPDRPYFVSVENFSTRKRRGSLIYGHPLTKSEIQYDPDHVFIRTAVIDGTLDVGFSSHAAYMRRYRYAKATYEMNGFSGGAVFSLVEENDGWAVHLDGIVVRAGNGYLYIVDANYLVRALELFMAKWAP